MPTMNRRAAKRDGNERSIIDRFEKYGCVVRQLSDKGLLDLLVCTSDGGRTFLVEVKMPGKELNEDQQKFWDMWPGEKYVLHSESEVNAIDL